jgi:hypothetical protein
LITDWSKTRGRSKERKSAVIQTKTPQSNPVEGDGMLDGSKGRNQAEEVKMFILTIELMGSLLAWGRYHLPFM